MARLIFDIETVGENFDELDETTQGVLTRWIKKESDSEESYKVALEELKEGLGFSPLTGQIIVIGALDYETKRGSVFYQSSAPAASFEEEGIEFRALTEKEMLREFWNLALKYSEFVSFNGRAFDAPFLAIRSAINRIRPSRDLLSNRYLGSQRGVIHVDLQDQLTFYGALRRKGGLHLWTRAFGIKSPKEEGISGEEIGRLFREGKVKEIARYNVGDLRATSELYDYWQEYVKF